MKVILKQFLKYAFIFIRRRSRLKNKVLVILNCLPFLKARLQFVVNDVLLSSSENKPVELAELTPHARKIYADLKSSIEKKWKEKH